MTSHSYLRWLAEETPTQWWHDSGEPCELQQGLAHGAVGVTTNPVLAATTLLTNRERWEPHLRGLPQGISAGDKAELLIRAVTQNAASMFKPIHDRTAGKKGYVCAQVAASLAADRQQMWEMANRFHSWAQNIAIKLPVTAAGLDVLEDCAAAGMTVTATVSFTVPQVLSVAKRYRKGLARAREAGKSPGRCYAVIMAGRLDDYLSEIAADRRADVSPADIQKASIAVVKRAYALYEENGYEAELMVAAHRGSYHTTELVGAKMILSIHPKYQGLLLQPGIARDPHGIDRPIDTKIVERLMTLPEFVRAYEPDGMRPDDFISYGLTQRTLAQFQASWSQIEAIRT